MYDYEPLTPSRFEQVCQDTRFALRRFWYRLIGY